MSASHQGHATVVKMLLLKGSDSRVQDAEVRPDEMSIAARRVFS